MSLQIGVNLIDNSSPLLRDIIQGIVHVHAGCIIHDNTMATFMPPLDHSKIFRWWQARVDEASAGERQIIVYLAEPLTRTAIAGPQGITAAFADSSWPTIPATSTSPELEVAGLVSLATPFSETGPFRGFIEKLFASPLHRRKGVARSVMAKLEEVAWSLGRWSLLLDTTVGTDAEHVYPRLGYRLCGGVKEFGFSPRDGSLLDEIWFAKDLRKDRRLWEDAKEEQNKEETV